jgi:hypothetical protein
MVPECVENTGVLAQSPCRIDRFRGLHGLDMMSTIFINGAIALNAL